MKISTMAILGLAVGVSSWAVPASAAVNVNRNGVNWAGTFEGDVSPLTSSTPAWGVFDNNGFAAESSDGNIYSYVSGAVGVTASYSMADATWTGGGTARTAEIRARVPDNVGEAADGVGSLILGINDQAYDLRFHTGFLSYNGGSGLVSAATLDTSEYHIYRLTVDQAANPIVNLYIDNNPTPVFTSNGNWFTSSGFNSLVFGDISAGGESGKMDVDYISWSAGAIAPVPEPAALAFLPVACLLLRRRGLKNQA